MEIELKLACHQNALELFEEKVLPQLSSQNRKIHKSHFHLQNDYYDTPENYFGKRQMGCRVRGKNNQFEQTIKTKGQVQGGLHQRPEYNVTLDNNKPNLRLFPADIWHDDIDVSKLDEQLEVLFSTHFDRTTFTVTTNEYELEIVFDFGEVQREQESLPICEIELELVKGDASVLFAIAEQIIQYVPCRLSDITKAARGYLLMSGRRLEVKELPRYLPLSDEETTEEAFCKAISQALDHWQFHQQIYMQSGTLKALHQIRLSVLLLLQSVALYLPVLQCSELLDLHKQLLKLSQAWSWQEQLHSIRRLRSKNGPFSRRIPKSQNLMNYLLGRREGLLNAHRPEELTMSPLSTKVQLAASQVIYTKPWKTQISSTGLAVKKHANGWLSQSWQTIQQSLPQSAGMDDKQYLTLDVLLRQALINGFLLADLFADSRGSFRDPWLDLAAGIEELKALKFLRDACDELTFADQNDLNSWIEDKTYSVIKVMEQTREVAMDADIYW